MRSIVLFASISLALVAVATPQSDNPHPRNNAMLKAVVHVNYDDTERQEAMLGNLKNILKAESNAEIMVVAHGKGVSLVQKQKSPHAEAVQSLVDQGVRFVACENTMETKELTSSDLLPGVSTVPSGAVEILRKQQEGFGYFRP